MNFDEVVKKYPEANFLQSPEYGKMNELLHDKVIVSDFNGLGHALMIVRNAKRGRYLEIPCGPLTDWTNKKTSREVHARSPLYCREQRLLGFASTVLPRDLA